MNTNIYPQPGDTFIISEKFYINVTSIGPGVVSFEEFKDGKRSTNTYKLKDFWKRLRRKEIHIDTMPLPWSGDTYFGYIHGKDKKYVCATYQHGARDFNAYFIRDYNQYSKPLWKACKYFIDGKMRRYLSFNIDERRPH